MVFWVLRLIIANVATVLLAKSVRCIKACNVWSRTTILFWVRCHYQRPIIREISSSVVVFKTVAYQSHNESPYLNINCSPVYVIICYMFGLYNKLLFNRKCLSVLHLFHMLNDIDNMGVVYVKIQDGNLFWYQPFRASKSTYRHRLLITSYVNRAQIQRDNIIPRVIFNHT